MAKMNLSVIMETIDKTSAVVKKITATQSKYAKQLGQVKEQSQKISSNQALISNFKKTGAEASKNKSKLNGAKDKLSQLNEKMSASKKPSVALQNQFKKQQQAVKNLKVIQGEFTKELTKTQNKLKTAGVNVSRLNSEEKRLSTEYNKRISQMDKLAKKEARLQKVRSKLSKFKMPNIGGKALAKGGAIIGGLSFAGLFSQLNGAAGEMDSLTKKAQMVKMPVEEFQAIQSQAEHAGISADQMGSALNRLTFRFGNLQSTGGGALGGFLKTTKNPLFRELKAAKNTEEAYGKVLNAFGKLKTNQEQMAFADAAFGDDGRKMLLLLREGTIGLSKARKEFNDLGGGVKTEDAQKAEAYNDAMQKVQESIRSIKFAALAPIMAKMTKVFTVFSDKFKNAKWREGVIKKVTETVTTLYSAFKILGGGFMWASQHIPELVAGIALLKIGFFALNAAMIANPIGLIVAGVAALVVGITYLIVKAGGITEAFQMVWETFKSTAAIINDLITPSVDGMGGTFDRVKAGFVAGIALIKAQFLIIPRAIMKALSLIPSKLLPDGWGENIKSAQKQLEEMNSGIVNDVKANIEYAIKGSTDSPISDGKKDSFKEAQKHLKKMNVGIVNDVKSNIEYAPTSNTDKPLQSPAKNEMLKHPSIQSKSQVEVRIKSDKPVEITQAKSDRHTEMMVDTGELLGSGF